MANLVDIFTQTSGLKGETTVLGTSEDLPKDKPSLFDSLLKTSIEEIESSTIQAKKIEIVSQNSSTSLTSTNLEDEVLELDETLIKQTSTLEDMNIDENIDNEKITKEQKKDSIKDIKNDTKEPIKNVQNSSTSKNSFLDRLILEVKNNNLEQVNQSEQSLTEPSKNVENSDILTDEKSFIKSLDEIVKDIKKENNIEEKVDTSKVVISENDMLVEVVEKEIVSIDGDKNTTKIENIATKVVEVLTPKIVQDLENGIKDTVLIEDAVSSENILIIEDENIEEKV